MKMKNDGIREAIIYISRALPFSCLIQNFAEISEPLSR